MPLARCAGLVVLVALFAGCGGGGGDGRSPSDERLPIRVIVSPNPAAGDVGAEFRLLTVPTGDEEPEIVFSGLMSSDRTDATIDVAGIDELAIHVDDIHIFTVPRTFWEAIIRGRLVLRLGPGGVGLTRSVEATDANSRCSGSGEERTCWATETWYFPGGLWDEGSTISVPLVVPIDPTSTPAPRSRSGSSPMNQLGRSSPRPCSSVGPPRGGKPPQASMPTRR